jgi:pimeloyl-ACP methyl ester carboxylesterase
VTTAADSPTVLDLPEPPQVGDVTVAGLQLRVSSGGKGSPLLVLHRSTGNLGWLPIYQELASRHAVYVPDLPGYGASERPEWAREPRDLAVIVHRLLDRLGLEAVAVLGLGMGGWVAAEMACWAQSRITHMTLVGAPGPQPRAGAILDQMLVDYPEYIEAGFADGERFHALFGERAPRDVRRLWENSREMTARITWKPYMFSRQLIHLLPEIETDTHLLWGEHDRIVPLDVGKQYEEALPNARLEVIPGAGHLIELEEPQRLAALVTGRLTQA